MLKKQFPTAEKLIEQGCHGTWQFLEVPAKHN